MTDPVRNFAKVQVLGGHNITDTIITLVAGDGAKLPNPTIEGDFNMTYWNDSDFRDPTDDPNRERVRVTGRNGDVLTIIRGQERTLASPKNILGKIYRMVIAYSELKEEQLKNHPLISKGDISVHDGIKKIRLPVGSNGQVLIADTDSPSGVQWGESKVSIKRNFLLMGA